MFLKDSMQMLLVIGLLVLNFGISWFNAYSVGRSWVDSKVAGGWPRFVVWCAAIMSASGFTWCYLIVLALVARTTGYLEPQYVQTALEIGYVIIIIPIIGSGLGIWIDSVTTAWRRRDFASVATAGWNTYAQAHNVYQAASTLPGIFSHLGDVFDGGDSDDKKSKAILFVFLLVLVALCGGVLTTVLIIRSTARGYAGAVVSESRLTRARS